LRSRILDHHVGGNTGSSTFRFTLASVLRDELTLIPRRTLKKLDRADNDRLRDWQREHLAVTWCVRPEPWLAEREVIARIRPPLNAAGNSAHPFHPTLVAARAAFRAAAR
jgi:hypothetical protein